MGRTSSQNEQTDDEYHCSTVHQETATLPVPTQTRQRTTTGPGDTVHYAYIREEVHRDDSLHIASDTHMRHKNETPEEFEIIRKPSKQSGQSPGSSLLRSDSEFPLLVCVFASTVSLHCRSHSLIVTFIHASTE